MLFFLGPKLLQLQNLEDGFVDFLGGQNRNFVNVRERKLLLSLKNNIFLKLLKVDYKTS